MTSSLLEKRHWMISVRITKSEREAIEAIAKRLNIKRAAVIKEMVDYAMPHFSNENN